MKVIHKIIVPIDFLQHTEQLVEYAVYIGEKFHAEEKMKQFVEKYRNSCSGCEGKILQGNVADSIVKYAKDQDADLLIIGTHGRKGLEKMWLGSVAERVIKSAPCPTLTCNPYK